MSDNQPQGPPRRIAPDRILAQVRVDGPDGEIGDTMLEIGPEHPAYERWDAWLKGRDQ
jgi:hypothetical protein